MASTGIPKKGGVHRVHKKVSRIQKATKKGVLSMIRLLRRKGSVNKATKNERLPQGYHIRKSGVHKGLQKKASTGLQKEERRLQSYQKKSGLHRAIK